MKQLTLPLTLLIMLCLIGYNITRAGDEETASSLLGRTAPEYKMVYEYPLMHRDGSKLPLKLIEIKNQCKVLKDIGTACLGGFTTSTSQDNTNGEYLKDTQEVIHLTFKKGKKPTIRMEEALHEITHSVTKHYLSRDVCKANFRYSECQEAMAYDLQSLYNQVRQLERDKLIRIEY